MTYTRADLSLDQWGTELRSKWGWFVALGIALLILGIFAFANLLTATVASVFVVGSLMIVAGFAQIINAFQVKRWSGFFFWLLSGLLYGAAGFLAFYNPVLAAATLTLIFAITLIVAGLTRIWSSLQLRPESGWGWIMASGVLTTLVGIVFILGWPVNSLWLLGLVLAIDLTFQGVSDILLGFALKAGR
jgi:uncharacterized membrane protein HdeD (DUF308 family)